MGQEVTDAPAGKGRSPYREQYSAYAARYDSSERTIKRWVADGLAAIPPDPCPLDDPPQLRHWWTRRKSQKVPDAIVQAAAALSPLLELPVQPVKPAAPPVGDSPPAAEPSAPPAPPRVLVAAASESLGLIPTFLRAQEREYQAHHEWLTAPTAEAAAFAERRLRDATESVRKLSGDVTAERIRLRDYIPRLEAENQLTEFHADLLIRFRSLGEAMARALRIPFTIEVEARWNAAIDEGLCELLQSEVFVEVATTDEDEP